MSLIQKDLEIINQKVDELKSCLVNHTKDLDSRGIRWFQYDKKKETLLSEGNADNTLVSINVGGKPFSFKLSTILNNPDNLLFNMLITDEWDYKEELYIDRSYTYFNYIATYLRNKNICLNNLKDEEAALILKEAEFYNLEPLINLLKNYTAQVTYVSFEFSGEYRSGTVLVGTNNVDDLNNFDDTSCTKGICTNYTGWIILELNRVVEFEEMEIGGCKHNTSYYAASNGSGATILTSLDKTDWVTVGTINSLYANGPYLHKLTRSKAKYVKFQYSSYIGIGYCRIIT